MDLSKLNALKPPHAIAVELIERTDRPNEALLGLAQLYQAYVKGWARPQISRELRQRFQSSTVVQETMIRLQGQLDRIECRSVPEFENYLLKTARSVISDLRRHHFAQRRSLLKEIPLEELESQLFWDTMRKLSEPNPHEIAAERDESDVRMEQIRIALLATKPHYRKVIREHFEKGKSIEEIARDIGRSRNATRMLIARALKDLQGRVESENA